MNMTVYKANQAYRANTNHSVQLYLKSHTRICTRTEYGPCLLVGS
jgi:hypothetical protein